MTSHTVPSGGLTLIVRAQKWGFSCKVQRRSPADIFLNESLPPKTPLWTPCPWPPCSWFTCEKLLKIFKVLWKIRNFDPHFKNLYLARKWVQRAHIGLVWKLVLRTTHSVLQHFRSDHLLEYSKAMNEPQKMFKWPWKIKVLSTSSKFRSCASLKTCDLQILGNA
jgi:hypothetical protein